MAEVPTPHLPGDLINQGFGALGQAPWDDVINGGDPLPQPLNDYLNQTFGAPPSAQGQPQQGAPTPQAAQGPAPVRNGHEAYPPELRQKYLKLIHAGIIGGAQAHAMMDAEAKQLGVGGAQGAVAGAVQGMGPEGLAQAPQAPQVAPQQAPTPGNPSGTPDIGAPPQMPQVQAPQGPPPGSAMAPGGSAPSAPGPSMASNAPQANPSLGALAGSYRGNLAALGQPGGFQPGTPPPAQAGKVDMGAARQAFAPPAQGKPGNYQWTKRDLKALGAVQPFFQSGVKKDVAAGQAEAGAAKADARNQTTASVSNNRTGAQMEATHVKGKQIEAQTAIALQSLEERYAALEAKKKMFADKLGQDDRIKLLEERGRTARAQLMVAKGYTTDKGNTLFDNEDVQAQAESNIAAAEKAMAEYQKIADAFDAEKGMPSGKPDAKPAPAPKKAAPKAAPQQPVRNLTQEAAKATIKVKRKSDGAVGSMPAANFDATKYDRVQ